jgi:hypothetical protein
LVRGAGEGEARQDDDAAYAGHEPDGRDVAEDLPPVTRDPGQGQTTAETGLRLAVFGDYFCFPGPPWTQEKRFLHLYGIWWKFFVFSVSFTS